jgi:tRNA modification GTPase
VGKSSILNALLGESRAIVTELPGTTRDVIEEGLDVGGVHVRLMDTAGMRDAADRLERLGVDRSKDAFNRADLVLLALDASSPLDGDDMEVIRHVGERPVIVLLNKSDLDSRIDEGRVAAELPGAAAIRVSAKEGWGLDGVHGEIRRLVFSGDAAQGDSPLVTNARHAALLGRAAAELQEALSLAGRGMPADIVETPLRVAWELLGEITGDAAADDIIERVFAKFCLGK